MPPTTEVGVLFFGFEGLKSIGYGVYFLSLAEDKLTLRSIGVYFIREARYTNPSPA